MVLCLVVFLFFNDTATTEIYTLSLHDALPILAPRGYALTERLCVYPQYMDGDWLEHGVLDVVKRRYWRDRKSTRLNSSHANISYAVFCLKKKIKTTAYVKSKLLDTSFVDGRVN